MMYGDYYHLIKKDDVEVWKIRKHLILLAALIFAVVLVCAAVLFYMAYRTSGYVSMAYAAGGLLFLMGDFGFLIQSVFRYRKSAFSKEVRELDWYMGENKDYYILMNMDYADEASGKALLYELDRLPDDSHLRAYYQRMRNKFTRRRDDEMAALFDLAFSQICHEQSMVSGSTFFTSDDFFSAIDK